MPPVVERKNGKACGRRALLARVDSGCGRCGYPVLQEPVLAAADGERWNRPDFRRLLLQISEASMMRSRPDFTSRFAYPSLLGQTVQGRL